MLAILPIQVVFCKKKHLNYFENYCSKTKHFWPNNHKQAQRNPEETELNTKTQKMTDLLIN